MTTKKKLFTIFGPVVLASILIVLLFLAPTSLSYRSQKTMNRASTAMSPNIIRGNEIKNSAILSDQYIPFFGSSELSRISPFHPSALAEKYNRNYRPFLLGAPGTQSLTHVMMMESFGNDIENKKIVFIISPQWFVKKGVSADYFSAYYSPLHTFQWIGEMKEVGVSEKYQAKRMLDFPKVREDKTLSSALQAISNGKLPNSCDLEKLHIRKIILAKEDELFGKFGMMSKQNEVKMAERELPSRYDYDHLDLLAEKIGKKSTSNNPFEISNDFYKHRLKKNIKNMKNAQVHLDYRFSPEYSDFQLVLNQLAKEKVEVLFIIPPVNYQWSNYTGLSQEMIHEFSTKITYQLKTQGFENIADFTAQGQTQYFMADTIHLGWRGWLASNQVIQPFLEEAKESDPTYKLNDFFYTKDWQEEKPSSISQNSEK